jgi:hypothetical protein
MGIQVPPDDTGKIVETNTPNTDHRQVVTIGDDTAATKATVGASGLEVDVQASVLPTGAAQSETDNSVYTMGTDPCVPMAAIYDNTPVNPTDGNVAALRCNVFRQLEVSVQGNAAGGTDGTPHGASQTGLRVFGSDGTNDQQISTNATGHVNIADGGNTITVDGTVTADAGTGTFAISAAALPLPAGAATSALQLADGHGVAAAGDVAHDGADSGNPVKIGHQVVEFGADPPRASADSDRTNSTATPDGAQWVMAGHPNIITREFMSSDTEADTDMLGAVGATDHVVVMGLSVMVDGTVSNNPAVRIGFGATTVPTEPATGAGVNGVVLSHPGLVGGSGVERGNAGQPIAIGGAGEELRCDISTITGGQINIIITYYVTTL